MSHRLVYQYACDTTHKLPSGYKILTAAMDPKGAYSFWAEVDTEVPLTEEVVLLAIGTGWGVPEGGEYISTFIDRELVIHVYKI